jgi:ubiquinone biosynthesis protein COQ9
MHLFSLRNMLPHSRREDSTILPEGAGSGGRGLMQAYWTLTRRELARFFLSLSGYIINRVLPAELRQQKIPEYLKNRLTMQDRCMQVIDQKFSGQILASVPEMERDVTGLGMIERMADAMYK